MPRRSRRQGVAPPAQFDYIRVPSDVSSPVERGRSPLPASPENEKNRSSAWQSCLPGQYFDDTSWYAGRFGQENQKPPTISSYDTRADWIDIFHKHRTLRLECRTCRKMDSGCAGHAAGNLGTSAIRLFHSLRTPAETTSPTRSRSTDIGDRTRVSSSQRTM